MAETRADLCLCGSTKSIIRTHWDTCGSAVETIWAGAFEYTMQLLFVRWHTFAWKFAKVILEFESRTTQTTEFL